MTVTQVGSLPGAVLLGSGLSGALTLSLPSRGGTLVTDDFMFIQVNRFEESNHPVTGFGSVESVTWPTGWNRIGTRLVSVIPPSPPSSSSFWWQEIWCKRFAGESNIPVTIAGASGSSFNAIQFNGAAYRSVIGTPAGAAQIIAPQLPAMTVPVDATILTWRAGFFYTGGTGLTLNGFTRTTIEGFNQGTAFQNTFEAHAKDVLAGSTTTLPLGQALDLWHTCYLPAVPIVLPMGMRLGKQRLGVPLVGLR